VAKESDFALLGAELARTGRAAVLIGSSAQLLAGALAGTVPLVRAANMEAAVASARALAQPGDIVLLSPACASFDMFRNYEERGDAFTRAVRALAGAEAL
jgi:UDP-N-acetylmuramoylalanine--D-glutamate ligase